MLQNRINRRSGVPEKVIMKNDRSHVLLCFEFASIAKYHEFLALQNLKINDHGANFGFAGRLTPRRSEHYRPEGEVAGSRDNLPQ